MFGYAYDPAGNLLSNYLTARTWHAANLDYFWLRL